MFRAGSALSGFFILLAVLAGCAGVHNSPASPGKVAVAVWDLEDMNVDADAYPSMGQMLSGQIIEAVRQGGVYQVVERQRLLAVLEELNLGSSALSDENTKLRVGRLSGASRMVFGGYQIYDGTMRIDLRLVDVESGKVLNAVQQTTPADDVAGWMNAASRAQAELFQ